jgi:hypothetical protein
LVEGSISYPKPKILYHILLDNVGYCPVSCGVESRIWEVHFHSEVSSLWMNDSCISPEHGEEQD